MDNNELYLMNPYKFETEKLRFEIGSKNYNYFNEEDYWVDLKCDGNFNKGYNEYLGLTIRYSVHKYIIKDVYKRQARCPSVPHRTQQIHPKGQYLSLIHIFTFQPLNGLRS